MTETNAKILQLENNKERKNPKKNNYGLASLESWIIDRVLEMTENFNCEREVYIE